MTQQPPGSRGGNPKYTWDDTVAAIGQDFAKGDLTADETISHTDVVRYMEPWEIGNPIYWDEKAAKQAGYRGIVVPWSAIKQTFAYGGYWRPGEPTRFPSADPNVSARLGQFYFMGDFPRPATSLGVFTDMEIEFFEPVCVGDQITQKGMKLVSVRPRQTRIGSGAFTLTETEFYNQRGELVARAKQGMYNYTRE